jgi:hypothetical protein
MGRVAALRLTGIVVGLFGPGAVRSIHARMTESDRWPGGIVRIYDAAPSAAQPFRAAVRAWNTSGAHVRFEVVPRSEADVVVAFGSASKCDRGDAACAPVGHWGAKPEIIWLVDHDDPEDEAHILVHELGHVIGLEHSGGCTAMNPHWPPCLRAWDGHWRCRLLERPDIARAVELYGGRVLPARRSPFCRDGSGL